MKKLLIFLFLLTSSITKAQVTDSTVRQYIDVSLPDNSERKITPSLLRNSLNQIIDLINTKVNNAQITVSKDGKSVSIKPKGTSVNTVKTFELFEILATSPEEATMFTYKSKPVFLKKIYVETTPEDQTVLAGIDHLYDVDARKVFTDANNYQHTQPGTYTFDTANKHIVVKDYECEGCTQKAIFLTIKYTKQ
ncbi:hypothetical protein VB796_06470 [Arcicella sp. LKC2W]|uniref:hypothetical protein n=1 Tax=Arcicella sp. LKC2W TaxID=2984198 RepID=UPI002B1F8138|nr:hypothetical protein [Arcicella sp. LKC2W]MEA5458671.1 hypothetical protein [Arcicella sp. LKC2W]